MGPEPVHLPIICLQVSDMKSCFFIGHRGSSCSLLPLLDSAVEQHITEFGVEEFIVGGYGNFDRMVTNPRKLRFFNTKLRHQGRGVVGGITVLGGV